MASAADGLPMTNPILAPPVATRVCVVSSKFAAAPSVSVTPAARLNVKAPSIEISASRPAAFTSFAETPNRPPITTPSPALSTRGAFSVTVLAGWTKFRMGDSSSRRGGQQARVLHQAAVIERDRAEFFARLVFLAVDVPPFAGFERRAAQRAALKVVVLNGV